MGQRIAEIEKKIGIAPIPQSVDPLVALEHTGRMEENLKMSGELGHTTNKKFPIPSFQLGSSDPNSFHRAYKTLGRYKLEKAHPDHAYFFKELKEEVEINLLTENDCLRLLRLISAGWVRQLIENLSELKRQDLFMALHNAIVATKSLEQRCIDLEVKSI